MTTRWKLRQDMKVARRSDGLVVVHEGQGYFLLSEGALTSLSALSLEAAVEEADLLRAPTGWAWSGQAWTHTSWIVAQRGTVWVICDKAGLPLAVQPHERAYTARSWCELRLNRAGRNLRGPLAKDQNNRST